jgi:hypothetical protein
MAQARRFSASCQLKPVAKFSRSGLSVGGGRFGSLQSHYTTCVPLLVVLAASHLCLSIDLRAYRTRRLKARGDLR